MIKIVIIGAGFMGRTHADAYLGIKDVEIAAICDRDEAARTAFAEKYGCRAAADFDELIRACEFDVVDICLPTFLHEEIVLAAAQAKKDIFCEKPLTLTVASLDRMYAVVRENQVRLMVAQVLHFWPEYVRAKEMFDRGEFGEIQYAYAARLSEHPKWSDWYRRAENSGGGLFDLHLHDIDYFCWLFGEVESVYAVGKKNDYDCWNHVVSILNFRNGVSATAHGVIEMTKGYPFTMELRLTGSRKTYDYVMRAGENLEDRENSLRRTTIYDDDGAVTVPELDPRDAYALELAHFAECAAAKRESEIVRLESVRNALCTLEALKKSLESGALVTVDYGRRV